MNPVAPLITKFLREWLPLHRGASINTQDSYAHAFRLLFAFAGERLKIPPSEIYLEQIDEPLVLHFLTHLETGRGCTPNSRNVRLAAIKSFMRFVEGRVPSALEQVRRITAIPAKKTESRLIRHLTQVQIQALLDAPNPTTRSGIRDRAMLHLAFAAGLRVSELVGLRLADLTVGPQPSVRVRGKGRRERALPLWKQTTTALRAWLAVRGDAAGQEIFLNQRGEPITRSGFEYILETHVTEAARRCPSLLQQNVSPHVLRHSCAMTLLQATGDIRKVSLWLGHASITTTEVYTRVDSAEKLEILGTVVPPSLRRGRFTAPDRLILMLRGDPAVAASIMRSSVPPNPTPQP